jgi:hypothetical protein
MSKADANEIRLENTWSDPRNRLRLAEGFCGHCKAYVAFKQPAQSDFHIVFEILSESEDEDESGHVIRHHFVLGICPRPSCQKATIAHRVEEATSYRGDLYDHSQVDEVVYPMDWYSRQPLAEAVPADLRKLYLEAASIESKSPNGAAFLARRILEQALRDSFGSKQRLVDLIDRFLDEEHPPERLHDLMTDIRQFGNIAGHPGQNIDGEWIDIDASEAGYTLDVASEVLDFVYVRPARQQAMRERWEAKKKGEIVDKERPSKMVLEAVPESERETRVESDDELPF